MRRWRCTSEIEALRLQHDGHGLVVERVAFAIAAHRRAKPGVAALAFQHAAFDGDAFDVVGLAALVLEVLDDAMHFVVATKAPCTRTGRPVPEGM